MNKYFKTQSSEKGVSLLITFFVMSIALAIILGVTIILLSEMTVIRGMGYSVAAFYAVDSGIEKTLFYDRKKIPEGGIRGICDICNSCNSTDCTDCQSDSGTDCDPLSCTDCIIEYGSTINSGSFYEKITVSSSDGDIYESTGVYRGISRAIKLSGGSFSGVPSSPGPIIDNTYVTPRSVPEGIQLIIFADIVAAPGEELDENNVVVFIQSPDEVDLIALLLENVYGDTYQGIWTGETGVYYVDIIACDKNGNCSSEENI